MRRPIIALAVLLLSALPGRAEELALGLSEDLVRVSSDFSGTDLVIFGAIETADAFATAEGRDIVVVVRGPETDVTVRRKQRVAGLWVNAQSVAFEGLPGFYYVASTRPLVEIAPLPVLDRYQLGLAALQGEPVAPEVEGVEAFRAAAIRLKARDQLYQETDRGVELLSASLFRATVPMPANVPPGSYKAEVYLFRAGTVVSALSQPLYVDKTGFERTMFRWATENAFLYGLAAVLLAIASGWLASAVFQER